MFAARAAFMAGKKISIPPTVKSVSSAQVSAPGSITLPAHSVGDMILINAWSPGGSAVSAPSASGTVPTWTTIGSPSSSQSRMAYAIATATNHTSGSWTNANMLIATIIANPGPTPIGGNAYSQSSSISTAIAPAVTLTNSNGSSLLLHTAFVSPNSFTASSTPSGYTTIHNVYDAGWWGSVRVTTKNSTQTDGSVTIATNAGGSSGVFATSTVEILAN